MPYDRDSRYDRADDYPGSNTGDYSRPYGSGRENTYSSARDYRASGGDDRDGDEQGRGGYGRSDHDRSEYGARDYGNQRYGQREQSDRGQGGYGQSGYGRPDAGRSGYGQSGYGQQGGGQYQGRGGEGREVVRGRDYGRPQQGRDQDERGFFDRAGDEVRSWFGDEEAERRRDMDQRDQERSGQTGASRHDDDYHNWRSSQISSLDRDYDEYRRENRSKFEKEFSDWRSNRQTQRQSLGKVKEHQEVVGSDGAHVGTVDKVRGDRIILTKTDKDADGHHHSVPCGWIMSVDDTVMLNRSADEAKQAWRDEEQDRSSSKDERTGRDGGSSGGNLNRSFPGTY